MSQSSGDSSPKCSDQQYDIDVGDINNDGLDDVFTASFSYGGTTQLFINDGLGGFLPSRNLAIGPTGTTIGVGDLNGDGGLEVIGGSTLGLNATLNGNNDIQLLAGATQVSVSTSGSATAGVPFAVTVTALDADGNVVTGLQETVEHGCGGNILDQLHVLSER